MDPIRHRTPAPRRAPLGLAPGLAVLLLAACGNDGAADAPEDDPQAVAGQQIFQANGCTGCHSTTGGRSSGPPLDGVAGQEVELSDGTTIVRDDEYLARSITDPSADIVAGFPDAMPRFNLDDEDVDALVAYIRSLG
jgi:cytochrome c oxidase subunit II